MSTYAPEKNIHLIDNQFALTYLVDIWSSRHFVAVDAEWVKLPDGTEKLCLIQVRDGEHIYLIRVNTPHMQSKAVRDLLGAFLESSCIKVLHDPHQDVIHFHKFTGKVTKNLFCTQIASEFLGIQDRMGYTIMLRYVLGILVQQPRETTSNWDADELSESQKKYAAQDVDYLYDCFIPLVYGMTDRYVGEQPMDVVMREEMCKLETEEYVNEGIYPDRHEGRSFTEFRALWHQWRGA